MALNGGRSVLQPAPPPPPTLPRVHGRPGPGRPVPPRPPPQTPTPPAPDPPEVSLAAPRPDGERRANEYVDTPLRDGRSPNGVRRVGASIRRTNREAHHQSVTLPVRHQPTTFKKDPTTSSGTLPHVASSLSHSASEGASATRTSILCPDCGRCRCESCREPRSLPSRWVCDNSCLCSAETILDYATCLCCVKGLFYHCGGENRDSVGCADDPCSCGGSRSCARWSCLTLTSVFLPCLLCYLPLRGLVTACELCYARYSDNGCHCERKEKRPCSLLTPEKRLLDTD